MQSDEVTIDLYCRDPKESMIIAATNKHVDNLNTKLQEKLNPNSPALSFCDESSQWYKYDIRVNDPILFTQNNYEKGYQNGSLGILIDNTQDMPSGKLGTVRLIDTGKEVCITHSILDHLKLGYAITLHKAQGSQFKNVIVCLDKTQMIDRSWLYTAITRSEKSLYVVGDKQRLIKAVNSESAFSARNAYLGSLIQRYAEKNREL